MAQQLISAQKPDPEFLKIPTVALPTAVAANPGTQTSTPVGTTLPLPDFRRLPRPRLGAGTWTG